MSDGGGELDLSRLGALAQRLGESPERVAQTLVDELEAAVSAIDAGLARGELDAVAHAAHAAQSSALMIGAGPTLAALRAIEAAAGARDGTAARTAHGELADRWTALAVRLRQL
jgi:hypothetical protein